MSDYGVSDDPEGALPWSWAAERLSANRNYWVITVDAVGQPHAMPVWGVWHDDESFWFSCSPTALKVRNIAQNPRVVVATSDTAEVVSVEGVANAQHAPHDIALAWATKYHDSTQTIDEMIGFFASNASFCVAPTKAIGLIERADEFAQSATRWTWAT